MAPGSGLPRGQVRFLDGAAVLGTASLSSSGVAVLSVRPTVGTHQITATYLGSYRYEGATSEVVEQVVEPAATTTAAAAPLTGAKPKPKPTAAPATGRTRPRRPASRLAGTAAARSSSPP